MEKTREERWRDRRRDGETGGEMERKEERWRDRKRDGETGRGSELGVSVELESQRNVMCLPWLNQLTVMCLE